MVSQVNIPSASKEVSQSKDKLSKFGQKVNGKMIWLASWYASVLGYASLKSFMPTVRKAERISLYLGIPIEDNFERTVVNEANDIKLTRFACIIIALQADLRKPMVKRARAFFLEETKDLNQLLGSEAYIQRMVDREQLAGLFKLLNKRAKAAGVRNYKYFQNEGYLGLYEKTASELRSQRGLSDTGDLINSMGTVELAANIFRITLIIEKLKRLRNPSEEKAAAAHWGVGAQVRLMVKDNTGRYPEQLSKHRNLKSLQKALKETQKRINAAK